MTMQEAQDQNYSWSKSISGIDLLPFPTSGDTKLLLGKIYAHTVVFCSISLDSLYFITIITQIFFFTERIVNYLSGFCSIKTFTLCFNFTNEICLLLKKYTKKNNVASINRNFLLFPRDSLNFLLLRKK